jgi:hypothetical protein
MPRWILQSARFSTLNSDCGRVSLASIASRKVGMQATKRLAATSCYHFSSSASYCSQTSEYIPLRKQLKDEARAKRLDRLEDKTRQSTTSPAKVSEWKLTVGIEIHAQLNTARKLFSRRYSTRYKPHRDSLPKQLREPRIVLPPTAMWLFSTLRRQALYPNFRRLP